MKYDGLVNALSSIVVIIIGLLVGFVILLITNTSVAIPAFVTLLTFGVSSMRIVGNVLMGATPIILTGLSVAFAFKTGLFNIGASGQFTFGGFVAIWIGVEFLFLPPWLRILTAILAAAVVGALWGAIPGLLKAYRNVHEVISSIMTNYIGMFFVTFMINNFLFDAGRGTSTRIPDESALPSFGLENIFADHRPSDLNIGFIIAIIIAILIYIILEKTVFGYELKACGFNKDAAKYAGINQNRNIVYSMMISGSLAGIGGALMFLNTRGLSMSALDTLAMEGFTGISVAFLGLNNPIGIIFSGLFISYVYIGGTHMQIVNRVPIELVEVVISVIIYFCAFVMLVKAMFGQKIIKFFDKNKKEVKSS